MWLLVFMETVISDRIKGPLYPLTVMRTNPIVSAYCRNQRGYAIFDSLVTSLCRFVHGMLGRSARE
jgi:hypothetical protein